MEIVVSFGILALLFLSLSYLFIGLLGGSAKAANKTVGSLYAEEILETVIRDGTYVNSSAARSEGIYSLSADNETQFFYTVNSEPIAAVTGTHKGGHYVRVTVSWWGEGANAERAGQGKLTTEVGRFITPKTTP